MTRRGEEWREQKFAEGAGSRTAALDSAFSGGGAGGEGREKAWGKFPGDAHTKPNLEGWVRFTS